MRKLWKLMAVSALVGVFALTALSSHAEAASQDKEWGMEWLPQSLLDAHSQWIEDLESQLMSLLTQQVDQQPTTKDTPSKDTPSNKADQPRQESASQAGSNSRSNSEQATASGNSVNNGGSSAAQTAGIQPIEMEVVKLVNQERQQRGLQSLKADAGLSKVARDKSQDMIDNHYFSHDSPRYGSPFDMMKAYGISYRAAAENIAAGQTSAKQVVEGWMKSDGHRANILNPDLNTIGVGYAKGGSYGHYWTQMFIQR